MKPHVLTVLWFFSATFAFPNLLLAQADEPAARFIADYSPHAESLRAFYTNREIRYRDITPARGSDGWQSEVLHKVRFNHENYVFIDEETIYSGGKPGETRSNLGPSMVAGRNRQYAFDLRVKGPNEYVIRKVTLFNKDYVEPNSATLCRLCFPYADPFHRLTYLEMARSPDHKVIEYSDAKWRDGRPVKEVKFRSSVYLFRSKERTFAINSYFFDPANGWVCVGNRATGEKGGDSSGEYFDYESAGEPLPAVKRWEAWSKSDDGPERVKWYSEVIDFHRINPSEEEFRLSAFGLPEPVGIVWEKPTPRYIWFLVAASALGLIAVGFRYLARRRTAHAAT